ncbi:helix-turn-helix transcriptional regulator [Nodularia harveyana UHCC-0300]|uniref:Helix-turn-helix transcriptional regulator n=1 Tax=Nodularia harveyana UHCC-0300 TaxID=2974287 RepID=A0ABU5U8R0_9CYAN|nr:helix-turn-helix transcriptional regulator [Nodularia harveyana]MEA5579907.1 helix-turn-helix transcriptional regulator [Nodularia harveyana UHCC-0300]
MTSSIFTEQYGRFRELLVQYRHARSITQAQLAEALNRPQSFVSKYESGERRLDIVEFIEISEALQFDPCELIRSISTETLPKPTIMDEWEVTSDELTILLLENPSLRGMLFGYVAELKLREIISAFPGVRSMKKFDDHDRKKKGDLHIIYHHRVFSVESKSLQKSQIKFNAENKLWLGKAQVDASDSRIVTFKSGKTLKTTLLLRGEFDILAVNCYEFNKKWQFQFARNRDLPCSSYKKYTPEEQCALISSLIPVTWPPQPPFHSDLKLLLDEMLDAGEGSDPSEFGLE